MAANNIIAGDSMEDTKKHQYRNTMEDLIVEAILSLKEKMGSTMSSIRGYMEYKYDDKLPQNFRATLSKRLERAQKKGRLQKLRSRFMLTRTEQHKLTTRKALRSRLISSSTPKNNSEDAMISDQSRKRARRMSDPLISHIKSWGSTLSASPRRLFKNVSLPSFSRSPAVSFSSERSPDDDCGGTESNGWAFLPFRRCESEASASRDQSRPPVDKSTPSARSIRFPFTSRFLVWPFYLRSCHY
eukprot:Gb_26275 [translate_table: standard]